MPLTQWLRYRQRRAQTKKALQMLALSGVIRPSNIELRYTSSPFKGVLPTEGRDHLTTIPPLPKRAKRRPQPHPSDKHEAA